MRRIIGIGVRHSRQANPGFGMESVPADESAPRRLPSLPLIMTLSNPEYYYPTSSFRH